MNKKKICAALLGIMLITPMFNGVKAFADTKSNNQNQININKDKINDLKDQKQDLQGEKNEEVEKLGELMGRIGEMTQNLDKHQAVVDEYQRKIDKITNEITIIENNIKNLTLNIENTETEIKNKEEARKNTEEVLGRRLSSYYKMDFQAQLIHMIFSSESFGDLVSNIFNINKILMTDQELMEELEKIKTKLNEDKTKLIQDKEKLDKDKQGVEANRAKEQELQEVAKVERDKWQGEVDKLTAIEDEKRAILSKLENKQDLIDRQIGDLIDNNKNLQTQIDNMIAGAGGSTSSGGSSSGSGGSSSGGGGSTSKPSAGGFVRPSTYPISSHFGPRKHPVTGAENGFHKGTDFAAPAGATTMAAKAGKVVYSGWMSGFGETIVIDHGSGIKTVYAHSRKRYVSVGQQVGTGQAIAEVGSTGMSTGPHLHFEVRVNNVAVNPMGYIS